MSAHQRETQLPVGPLLAALGAVLLIVSLFLNWYEDITAFTAFEFIDLLLLGLALVTIAALAAAMGALRAPVSPGLALAAAALALIVVFSQIVNDPPIIAFMQTAPDQDVGIWLALAASALMVAGAVLSTVRLAIAVEPRSRAVGPDADAPPPAATRADEAPTVRQQPPRP